MGKECIMKRACALRSVGAVAAVALALVGCSSGTNPVLSPGVEPLDAGDRGMQLVPDASPIEARPINRDGAADVAIGRDVPDDGVTAVDLAPPPRVTVTILFPAATGAADGGAANGGSDDGGAAVPVISSASRFAPKVSVEVESRGGDPTAEVLTSVKANLLAAKTSSSVASATLNQTQYTVLPESGTKSYLFSDTPLDLSKVPSGFYTLQIDAATAGGTAAGASVSIYVDGGPSITFLQPADGAYVKGSVIVTAIVDDPQAGVVSVTFSVGQTELLPGAVSSSGVQYTATIDFGSFAPPLDGPQLVTLTAVNGNNITSVATLKFTVDNAGPVINNTKPASGELIGKLVALEANVTDPAGVMSGSVVAVVAHGDIHFEVSLTKLSDETYRNIFDTTQLPSYAIYPSISFRAQDVLGNQSSVGYEVSLDNTPPALDLDPPANYRLYKKDGTCSWPFDPVGPDAIDDGSIVTQLFDIRARIEDQGNLPATGTLDFMTISGVDPATVKVLILDDSSLPLVVDTSDPPDGICDDVNPDLVPSVSPQSSKDAQLIDLVPLPANAGAGDFTYEPGSACTGSDANPPAPFCASTYSFLKKKYMTYSLGYAPQVLPAIWGIGPVVADQVQCAGRQFDAINNLHDGWACVAAEAADKLGNKQVSRPIRICVAAQPNSQACAPEAMGGASLASVTLPDSTSGKVAFVTSAPLLGAGGAAIEAGDSVVFTGLGPDAIARINGTHTVAPSDTTGTSFTITDVSISPAILAVDNSDPDGGAAVTTGSVGLVLSNAGPVHVVTTASTALDPAFKGQVLLSNAGISAGTRWSVTNIQPSGFDLVGATVQLSGGAVPLAKFPDCTGTIIKQASGLPPKVDATKPCGPWAAYPKFEGKVIN